MISFGFSPSYFDWRECGNNRIFRLWNWLYGAPPAVSNSALCAIFLVLVDFHPIQKHQFRIERQSEQSVCAAVLSATSMAVTPAKKTWLITICFYFFASQQQFTDFIMRKNRNMHCVLCTSESRSTGWTLAIIRWLVLLAPTLYVLTHMFEIIFELIKWNTYSHSIIRTRSGARNNPRGEIVDFLKSVCSVRCAVSFSMSREKQSNIIRHF